MNEKNKKILKYLDIEKIKKRDIIFTLFILIICLGLIYLPTGFEKSNNNNDISVKAKIISTDNTAIHQIGLLKTGVQYLKVMVIEGQFKGQKYDAINHFVGKLELDRFYLNEDVVFAVLETDGNIVSSLQVMDIYRIHYEIFLIIIFCLFLVAYGGFVGVKSVLSFFFTAIILWKIMIPLYLKGISPILLSFAIVIIITFVIIFLIAGFNKKGTVAFLGASSGVLVTVVLSLIFGALFRIPGEIKPFAETLLYSGFKHLNFSDIFLAGIFIANSGAIMDVAIDISTALAEIKEKKHNISLNELIFSGFTIGRAVAGTMTTTLLLAYSGGYSTLLMVFVAQGIPLSNVLNIQYVSSEILHTLVGSFGLVLVAPFTAIIGGILFSNRNCI